MLEMYNENRISNKDVFGQRFFSEGFLYIFFKLGGKKDGSKLGSNCDERR